MTRGVWVVAANAVLWATVGAGVVLAVERVRDRAPTLADLADEAAARMDDLDLTEAQRTALASIRSRWREAILAEESGWQERVTAAAATADREVAALLTAEQARRWRERALGGARVSK